MRAGVQSVSPTCCLVDACGCQAALAWKIPRPLNTSRSAVNCMYIDQTPVQACAVGPPTIIDRLHAWCMPCVVFYIVYCYVDAC